MNETENEIDKTELKLFKQLELFQQDTVLEKAPRDADMNTVFKLEYTIDHELTPDEWNNINSHQHYLEEFSQQIPIPLRVEIYERKNEPKIIINL